MDDGKTAQEILDELSPEAKKLAQRVLELEREFLHIKNPTMIVSKIADAAKELVK
ncbi:hypothetical protein Ppa06_00630 [Planomonospora parontospora subsp. parontospora]|uniref:Uncharacterized protein n=2 Tax=Planomonospora parontospora TaxID=58119 RepID=A0AA37BAW3_9ACTN|nr:hypothetical protein [Planomonospora parontospora]GGK44961.1 hypothetical protein GCM10010126_00630 [Planomonospora parontospora]GII06265.1 hypothetical protein Ppa06_00630 [Planomonospora parontospora subsp. parontospora]